MSKEVMADEFAGLEEPADPRGWKKTRVYSFSSGVNADCRYRGPMPHPGHWIRTI